MGLIIGILEKKNIPHEPGEFMEIRKLSWMELEEARQCRQDKALETVKKLQGMTLPTAARSADLAADPFESCDLATLLRLGIVAWSYPASVKDNIEMLDETTAQWAAREVYCLAVSERPNSLNGSSLFTNFSTETKMPDRPLSG